jgi:deoxyadenosine/deoxycytidine kinase
MRISIEGNIGAGKTSLLEALPKRSPWLQDHVDFFPEPIHEWGETLKRYLDDKKAWSELLTLDILRGFGIPEAAKRADRHQIVERSPYACRYVFTEILRNEGYIKNMQVIDEYMDLFGWKPDMVVLIDVPPVTCLERIETRARPGEETVTYEELRCVDYMYNKMIDAHFSDIPVVRCVQGKTESVEAFHARISILLTKTLDDDDKQHRLKDNQ